MSLPRWKYGVAVAAVAVTFGGMAVAGALPGLSYASGPTVKIVTAAAEETTTTSTTSTTTTTTKVDASTTTTTQEESTTTTAAPVVGGVTVTCVDDDHAKAKRAELRDGLRRERAERALALLGSHGVVGEAAIGRYQLVQAFEIDRPHPLVPNGRVMGERPLGVSRPGALLISASQRFPQGPV